MSTFGTYSSSWSPRGVFGSVCVITMLFFLSLPGHFSCPATFPMYRILPFTGKMNNTCVSLPYHLRDILLWDIPSFGSLGVGVREMRRERIALFSGDGALEAGDSSPLRRVMNRMHTK